MAHEANYDGSPTGQDEKIAIDKQDEKTAIDSTIDARDVSSGSVEALETTHRGLKARQAQMIALGGTIGTGLFVGSGAVLAKGGPLFILISYTVLSILVYFIVTAIVEVAAYLPVNGGTMAYYGNRNVSKSLGFAMGFVLFSPANTDGWLTVVDGCIGTHWVSWSHMKSQLLAL